jgi:hypothetical protein
MTTRSRQLANRRNARYSTGPRSSGGKAVSRLNAFRHGLSVPLLADLKRAPDVEQLAARLVGQQNDPARLFFARQAAEAELDLERVRVARRAIIDRSLARARNPQPDDMQAQAIADVLPELASLGRYEARAYSRWKRAVQFL